MHNQTFIQVECKSAKEALESGKAGADIVMLDNMSPIDALNASQQINNVYSLMLIEVSGVSIFG